MTAPSQELASTTDTVITTAASIRDRARRDMIAAMVAIARRQLQAGTLDDLSLRAITRELEMAPSAIYRYFANRDDLIGALLTEVYSELGEAAQSALASSIGMPPAGRWLAVCQSVRTWALHNVPEFLLLYSIPSGSASQQQAPASRVGLALVAVVADAQRRGLLQPVEDTAYPKLLTDATTMVRQLGVAVTPGQVPNVIAVWAQLFGLISFEVLGQFDGMITARDDFFDEAIRRLGQQVGIR